VWDLKIADGIEMLEIPMKLMGRERIIYPTLIWDDNHVILVDTGIPDSLPEIKDAMEKADVPFERLDIIMVTHQDMDHVGGIKGIINEISDIKILAHGEDKPYIEGDKQWIRLTKNFINRINSLPDDEKDKVMGIFNNSNVQISGTLSDGEELEYCGGITIIHTPGHTPGHICLYHKQSCTLIVGDTMNIVDGQLIGPNTDSMDDKDAILATTSFKKFENYEIKNLITYHGGLFNDKPDQKIRELF
jgi:glyoxylase-like metal-dependent hydrolase (beta-lactamase superfamily II)